jgi:hypothetical protein
MQNERVGSGKWKWILAPLIAALVGMWAGCGEEDKDDGEEPADVEQQTGNDVTDSGLDVAGGQDICAPDCAGRKCGSDGCGGSCGNCFDLGGGIDNSLCQADGTCAAPKNCSCAGKICGDDGCGGSCGNCPEHYACNQYGMCDSLCSCTGKTCGDDGCGGSCGECKKGYFCNDQFACEKAPIVCSENGFSGPDQFAKIEKITGEPGFYFYYHHLTSAQYPFDAMVLEMDNRPPLTGPSGPGTYEAPFENMNQGGLWLWMVTDYTQNGPKQFLAPISGQIVIEQLDAAGGQFKATLKDVTLQEASVNSESGIIGFVDGGLAWCLDNVEMVADIEVTEWGQYDKTQCVTNGSGLNLGNNIRDFEIQNCKGEWVTLHEACGKTKATWLVATAGW